VTSTRLLAILSRTSSFWHNGNAPKSSIVINYNESLARFCVLIYVTPLSCVPISQPFVNRIILLADAKWGFLYVLDNGKPLLILLNYPLFKHHYQQLGRAYFSATPSRRGSRLKNLASTDEDTQGNQRNSLNISTLILVRIFTG
jgi:hypothetical protein